MMSRHYAWLLQFLAQKLPSGCAISLARTLCLLSLFLTAPNYNFGAGNFDECLEIIDDASSCRCGSGLEEIFILDGGAGYVPGTLQVSVHLHVTLSQCARPLTCRLCLCHAQHPSNLRAALRTLSAIARPLGSPFLKSQSAARSLETACSIARNTATATPRWSRISTRPTTTPVACNGAQMLHISPLLTFAWDRATLRALQAVRSMPWLVRIKTTLSA